MEIIKMNKEDLEYIRKMSEDSKIEIPYPIYFEYDKNKSIIVEIKYGKYIHYFTHVEVVFVENILIQNIKMLVRYNRLEINADNIKNASISSTNDIDIIKQKFS